MSWFANCDVKPDTQKYGRKKDFPRPKVPILLFAQHFQSTSRDLLARVSKQLIGESCPVWQGLLRTISAGAALRPSPPHPAYADGHAGTQANSDGHRLTNKSKEKDRGKQTDTDRHTRTTASRKSQTDTYRGTYRGTYRHIDTRTARHRHTHTDAYSQREQKSLKAAIILACFPGAKSRKS